MKKKWHISRRTALRGLGTALALPLLDSMSPLVSLAGASESVAVPSNLRLGIWFVPNGIHMQDWKPATEGMGFEMTRLLEPLAAHREKLLVLGGLTHDKARANGDGGGDHARSASVFLTGCQPLKTDGANIRVGVSVDQLAAEKIGHETRFPSLEIGCDRGAQSGNCDSGYSCAYSSNISWKSESTPMAKEVDPRLVFERFFGSESDADVARAERLRYRKSVLDYVREDARRLQARLGGNDRRKLDEYLTSVRELERQIAYHEAESASARPQMERPDGIPQEYETHIRLMADLQALAFQTGLTRLSTYMLANEGSNRSYPFIGVSEGHHDLSHHGNDEAKQAKISDINLFHIKQFACFLDRLSSMSEGEGSVLDNSIILYGSGIGDGNRHNHDDLPVVLAGGGAGTLATGRFVQYPKETPMNNLYLSLLDRFGVDIEAMGDSTGRLEGWAVSHCSYSADCLAVAFIA